MSSILNPHIINNWTNLWPITIMKFYYCILNRIQKTSLQVNTDGGGESNLCPVSYPSLLSYIASCKHIALTFVFVYFFQQCQT